MEWMEMPKEMNFSLKNSLDDFLKAVKAIYIYANSILVDNLFAFNDHALIDIRSDENTSQVIRLF